MVAAAASRIDSRIAAPPLALYVHVPWCVRKCPYCDFNSHVHRGALPESRYVEALLADLVRDLPLAAGRRVESIFIGGGTPSLFAPESIARLLAGIAARSELVPGLEVTLEANPGTVERGRFAGYRDAGVTRVSVGAQSFAATALQALGRIHGPADTASAVAELRDARLANFNLDLMYALPDQDRAGALVDVERALALAPVHLSHYQLTLEPGTVFHHRPPRLPDEDVVDEMQHACHARLAAAGFRQYEVSAWARPGAECRHNLNYWRYGDYLGIGAGAHGKLTDAPADRIVRTLRLRGPREYLEAEDPRLQPVPVPHAERPFEFMLNALRLTDGFAADQYETRTGLPLAALAGRLEALEGRGLLDRTTSGWRPSELGLRFLNDLQAEFLPSTRAPARSPAVPAT